MNQEACHQHDLEYGTEDNLRDVLQGLADVSGSAIVNCKHLIYTNIDSETLLTKKRNLKGISISSIFVVMVV